jgi:anti-sigma regulatory factor (Ser/Thr protein kinase)
MIAELEPIVLGIIAAVGAAHSGIGAGWARATSRGNVKPAALLTDAATGWPDLCSTMRPVAMTLHGLGDLRQARQLLVRSAESGSAVDRATINGFSAAVHEVLVNALTHGAPPVDLIVWVETCRLTCEVVDCGLGFPDDFIGDQRPTTRAMGLRVARDLCRKLIVINQPNGGCRVILTTS